MVKVSFNMPYHDKNLKRDIKAGEVLEKTVAEADAIVKTITELAEKEAKFSAYKNFSYSRPNKKETKTTKKG